MGRTGDGDAPIRHMTARSSRAIKTGYQRFERPVYDYAAKYAPCRRGCPAGHDTAWATCMISKGRYDLALRVLREENPFPSVTGRVCHHPCEDACSRGDYDQPVAIQALERACAEYGDTDPVELAPRLHEESVGIIGAGPAGLACAYHLVRLGYPVTVYDANDTPGGILAYGIPAYRLPREVLETEIDRLRRMGVAFRCGVRIGVDLSFAQLRQSHHALFLAPGLARARQLSVPMPKDPRVESGVAFLRAARLGVARSVSGHVVVIGGGDVGIDAARSALRLGAEKVTLCCGETRTEMPAHPEEIEAARHEGVEILDRVVPARVDATRNSVNLTLLPVRAMRRDPDGTPRFDVEEGPGWQIRAARLLYAVGQEADLSFLPPSLAQGQRLRVDAWGQTSLPGVFAGGDITGAYGVAEAVGSAKRAVIGIDAWLRRLPMEGLEELVAVGDSPIVSMHAYHAYRHGERVIPSRTEVRIDEINLDYFPPAARARPREVDPEIRASGFLEVALPLSADEAREEAGRCFNCGTCNMCGNCFIFCPDSSVFQRPDWGFAIDLDHCKGCGVCVEECPRQAMSMVPESESVSEGCE